MLIDIELWTNANIVFITMTNLSHQHLVLEKTLSNRELSLFQTGNKY